MRKFISLLIVLLTVVSMAACQPLSAPNPIKWVKVTAAPNPVAAGQPIRLTAEVHPNSPGTLFTAKLSVDGKEVSSKEMTVNGDTYTTETLKLDTPGTHKIEFCGVTKTIRVIPMPGLQNILSEQQLLEDINKLEQDQLITRSVLNMISKVNSTIYYKLTGNTWENAKIATHFLNHNKYLHDTHTKLAGYSSPGKIWVDTGDAGKKIYPMGILLTLFHETGHVEAFRLTARSDIVSNQNYADFLKKAAGEHGLGDISEFLDENAKMDMDGLNQESLAYLFEDAAYQYLEDAGITMRESGRMIEDVVNELLDEITGTPAYDLNHSRGILIDWYRALNYPDTRNSLQKTGKITSAQAIFLYNAVIQKMQTAEGLGDIYAEIVTGIRTASEYTQFVRDALLLRERNLLIYSIDILLVP
jgi:hypothetical protein